MHLAKRKGDIPPEARGDAKWRNVLAVLTLVRDKSGRLGWSQCPGGGLVGNTSVRMGSKLLSTCSVAKRKKCKLWARMLGKVDLRKSSRSD